MYFTFCFTDDYLDNLMPEIYHQRRWHPRQQNNKPFKCVKPGLYPDPHDCSLYYECVKFGHQRHHLKAYVRKCDDGEVFSYQNVGACMKPKKSGRVGCDEYSRQNQRNRPGISKNVFHIIEFISIVLSLPEIHPSRLELAMCIVVTGSGM